MWVHKREKLLALKSSAHPQYPMESPNNWFRGTAYARDMPSMVLSILPRFHAPTEYRTHLSFLYFELLHLGQLLMFTISFISSSVSYEQTHLVV
jgi:hypothetical protein